MHADGWHLIDTIALVEGNIALVYSRPNDTMAVARLTNMLGEWQWWPFQSREPMDRVTHWRRRPDSPL